MSDSERLIAAGEAEARYTQISDSEARSSQEIRPVFCLVRDYGAEKRTKPIARRGEGSRLPMAPDRLSRAFKKLVADAGLPHVQADMLPRWHLPLVRWGWTYPPRVDGRLPTPRER